MKAMQNEWHFAWVCICILDGGHFSFPDANADPGTTGLALNTTRKLGSRTYFSFDMGGH